jgi:outer membrane protein OmpA-like peptidoglycan-associated protein
MIKRIFTLVAAVALLAACETASTTDSSATGSTTSAATSGTATATSSTAATTTSEEAVDPAEMMKKEFTKVGTTVLFDFDSSQLSDYARRVLDRQAAFLKG